MQGQYQIIAAVFFLAVAIKEGLAIHCVDCNSFQKKACDSDPSSFLIDCDKHEDPRFHNATACRKMEQEIYYDDDYQVRTIRQCAVEVGPMKCIERTGTYRFKVFYCHCNNEDGCNGAGALSFSLVIASLSVALAYFFKL
ncbi:hypothetical protein BaRGS_00015978 [Batillaria attramentaria]|uniref:Protein sleepless n=1 Tax=Batillaria attramentaria TaxID=370345 RepID=A0ABD0L0E5_9CAEN